MWLSVAYRTEQTVTPHTQKPDVVQRSTETSAKLEATAVL